MHAPLRDESDPAQNLARLEREESKLWRLALLLLGVVAVAMAAASWNNLRSLPHRLEAVPISAVIVILIFAAYAYTKKRQIAELRGMVRGLEVGAALPPSQAQVDRLTEVIANSQRGYRDLIDSFEDLMFSVDLEGRLRAVNRAFARMLELPFPEIVGRRLDEFFAEPTREEIEKELTELLERRSWSGLVRVRIRKTGAVRHLECSLRAAERDGVLAAITVLARDVTEQREREMRFTELFETLQEGVYFTTPEGTILDVNQSLVRMLGYDSKHELLARNAAELFCDPEERLRELQELEQSGAFRGREIRLRRKDGAVIACYDTARAMWNPERRQLRYQGTLVDITERRQIEARLHEEQEFRRRLVDSFPDLIVALDQTGRITFVSPRVKDMLGYEPQVFTGRNISDGSARACGPEFERLCRGLMAGSELFGTAEYPAQHADGSWRTLRACASPLFDGEGKLAGVVASVSDVSGAKQMERQLVQSEKMAAMGQMIDGFAHELNNPLTAILGALDLLAEQVADEDTRKKFQLLQQQARRAAEIVQNLLFFSRPPQPGSMRLNVNELVQRSLQLHEHSLRMNRINVDFLPEPGIPPLMGDPNQLMQVFLSLIINAEQAIREVREQGTLRVRLQNHNGRVTITFHDDGPGIAADVLPRIFDPFFTTKRPGRGSGLGLSIATAIMKKYGGDLSAANGPGGGALITVNLPLQETKAAVAN